MVSTLGGVVSSDKQMKIDRYPAIQRDRERERERERESEIERERDIYGERERQSRHLFGKQLCVTLQENTA